MKKELPSIQERLEAIALAKVKADFKKVQNEITALSVKNDVFRTAMQEYDHCVYVQTGERYERTSVAEIFSKTAYIQSVVDRLLPHYVKAEVDAFMKAYERKEETS